MATRELREQSLGIVREFNRAWNARDYEKMADLMSSDYVQHGPMAGMELRGAEESRETTQMFHAAFSDLKATEEFAFSDGEFVCTQYTYRGTHDDELMGIPATDVPADVRGVTINRIEDGKIAEGWVFADFFSLFQQVGVIPPLDEMGA